MRFLIMIMAAVIMLYAGVIALNYYGEEISSFFTDEVDLKRAEAEKKQAENEAARINNDHEKDMMIIQNQQERELSALFQNRLFTWSMFLFLSGMILILILALLRQNRILTDAVSNSLHLQNSARLKENLQINAKINKNKMIS